MTILLKMCAKLCLKGVYWAGKAVRPSVEALGEAELAGGCKNVGLNVKNLSKKV